ncbi:hypothetical protein [Peribacillus acanthi]|nr:hypothetical protein [Peribacillus acanthi]
MTIYHAHGKYFLQVYDGIREVSFAQLIEWEKQGLQLEILVGCLYD